MKNVHRDLDVLAWKIRVVKVKVKDPVLNERSLKLNRNHEAHL